MKFLELPSTKELAVENGVIVSVSIDNENHGCLTAWLYVAFRSGGCGFGGFKLGNADGDNLDQKTYAAEWIVRCIKTVIGYGKWEELKGKPVRCLREGSGGKIIAIGHFLNDDWFSPKLEFAGRDSK